MNRRDDPSRGGKVGTSPLEGCNFYKQTGNIEKR